MDREAQVRTVRANDLRIPTRALKPLGEVGRRFRNPQILEGQAALSPGFNLQLSPMRTLLNLAPKQHPV